VEGQSQQTAVGLFVLQRVCGLVVVSLMKSRSVQSIVTVHYTFLSSP